MTTNPYFSLAASPASLNIPAGQSKTTQVTVDAFNGFDGTVSFYKANLPTGVTSLYSPETVAGGGTATLILILLAACIRAKRTNSKPCFKTMI
mgnify:CR=1 FL=1